MTRATLRRQLEECLAELRAGRLTEERLQGVLDGLDGAVLRRQDLLYLQAAGTSVEATVQGMLLVQEGRVSDGPADPEEWPYRTVLEAIRDGWRVIQFPNLALLLDEKRTHGLGCEFILERWS